MQPQKIHEGPVIGKEGPGSFPKKQAHRPGFSSSQGMPSAEDPIRNAGSGRWPPE